MDQSLFTPIATAIGIAGSALAAARMFRLDRRLGALLAGRPVDYHVVIEHVERYAHDLSAGQAGHEYRSPLRGLPASMLRRGHALMLQKAQPEEVKWDLHQRLDAAIASSRWPLLHPERLGTAGVILGTALLFGGLLALSRQFTAEGGMTTLSATLCTVLSLSGMLLMQVGQILTARARHLLASETLAAIMVIEAMAALRAGGTPHDAVSAMNALLADTRPDRIEPATHLRRRAA
jgi:hypothetical protein